MSIATLLTRNETEADKEWTTHAIKNRNDVKIYSYNNLNNVIFMKNLKGGTSNIEIAKHDQNYKNYLMKASNNLKTDYPNDRDPSFKRDYYLIRDADSLYFSGYFDITKKQRLQIKGRESWLVEMYVNKIIEFRKLEDDQFIKSKITPKVHNTLVPIYMFSEDLKCWCQLNIKTLKWIYILRAPKPLGKYLAFGTDPISNTARIEFDII